MPTNVNNMRVPSLTDIAADPPEIGSVGFVAMALQIQTIYVTC